MKKVKSIRSIRKDIRNNEIEEENFVSCDENGNIVYKSNEFWFGNKPRIIVVFYKYDHEGRLIKKDEFVDYKNFDVDFKTTKKYFYDWEKDYRLSKTTTEVKDFCNYSCVNKEVYYNYDEQDRLLSEYEISGKELKHYSYENGMKIIGHSSGKKEFFKDNKIIKMEYKDPFTNTIEYIEEFFYDGDKLRETIKTIGLKQDKISNINYFKYDDNGLLCGETILRVDFRRAILQRLEYEYGVNNRLEKIYRYYDYDNNPKKLQHMNMNFMNLAKIRRVI